ncbi:MAG: hypothetical protein ABUS79_01020 [Pseudomonadota bacterium]
MTTEAWIAGLAAFLYAIDDAHGFAVGWLASRCTLMGTFFAIASLIAHEDSDDKGCCHRVKRR